MANGEGSSPGGGYDYREPFLEEPSAYYVKRVRALFLAADDDRGYHCVCRGARVL